MIPKLNSSELNDIFINAYNEVNDKINEFSEICSDLSKKTKIINYEIEYAKKAIELNKPIIGICAGFNNLLRAIGGEVTIDNTNSHNHLDENYRHSIRIIKDTKLYNIIEKDKIDVNSIHSMVAKKENVSKLAKVSSYSEDGLVESFELENKKFVIGIKWHPELMLNAPYVDKLFKTFIEISNEK